MKQSFLIGAGILLSGAAITGIVWIQNDKTAPHKEPHTSDQSAHVAVPVKTPKPNSDQQPVDHDHDHTSFTETTPSQHASSDEESHAGHAGHEGSEYLKNRVRASANRLINAIESGEMSLTQHEIVDGLFAAASESDEVANILSKKLVASYTGSNNPDKRKILAGIMLALPSEASQNLGQELINTSENPDEQALGHELARGREDKSQVSHEKILRSIWSTGTEGAFAINTINPQIKDSKERANVVNTLNKIVDTHSNLDVRASALMKMAEIDQSGHTKQRIELALTENDPSLKFASVVAATKNKITSPKIKKQLLAILKDTKQPAQLHALVRDALQEY